MYRYIGFIFFFCYFIVVIGMSLHSNSGRKFMVGFMENSIYSQLKYPIIYIVSSSPYGTVVNISSRVDNSTSHYITLPPFSAKHITFTDEFRNYGPGISNKGILIESSDRIAVFGANVQKLSPSFFLVNPLRCLGMVYYIMTIYPPSLKCQFLIAAIYNDTQVEITIAVEPKSNIVSFNGTEYMNGETILVTMDSFDAVQIQSKGDLTGTKLVSDKFLAVYNGNLKTNMIATTSNSDHLSIQLPPVETWGRYFIAVSYHVTGTVGYLKYLASAIDTNVTYNCLSNGTMFSNAFLLQNSGDYRVLHHDKEESCYILATRPILVVQVTHISNNNPSMVAVTPVEQYDTGFHFTRPYTFPNSYKHTLTLVAHQNATSDIRLNGSPIETLITYSQIPGTKYVTGSLEINDDYHFLEIASRRYRLWAILRGEKIYETYSVNVGMACCNINLPQEMIPGDGLDNDCDGHVDEEDCSENNENADDDEDGLSDEDCSLTSLSTSLTVTMASTDTDMATAHNATSTTEPNNGTNEMSCSCGQVHCVPIYSEESLHQAVQEIREKLSISKKETKKYRLSLISAEDNRASAVTIGYSGAIIIFIFFMSLIISDLPNLRNMVRKIKRNLRR